MGWANMGSLGKPMIKVSHTNFEYHNRVFLLEELPKNAICAEIGVYEGSFSEQILKICEPKMLHLIDWKFQPKFWENKEYLQGNFKIHERRFEDMKWLKNGYFDWVYLDADHKFLTTLDQLKMCYRKVKKGGIICGDDYIPVNIEGVVKAVDMFLRIYKNKVELEYIKNLQFKIRKIK